MFQHPPPPSMFTNLNCNPTAHPQVWSGSLEFSVAQRPLASTLPLSFLSLLALLPLLLFTPSFNNTSSPSLPLPFKSFLNNQRLSLRRPTLSSIFCSPGFPHLHGELAHSLNKPLPASLVP
ncbi:hypothetical protein MANI_007472 [Metarhizium anisopliae]|nr:hypothetical protein MANI_007472 [Metarhizium anisopliae]